MLSYGGLQPLRRTLTPGSGTTVASPIPKPPRVTPQPPGLFVGERPPSVQPFAMPQPQQPPPTGLSVTPGTQPYVGATPPPTPDAGISEFGPGNDLRSSQINPQASDRLSGVQARVGQGLDSLYTAPDRSAIAASQLDLLQQQSEPAFQKALQTVGQRAAALGRLGAGMTTSELGDVTLQREKALAQARQGLAADTAGQTLNDRLQRLNASSGLEGQLFGEESAARNELRGERGYQTDTANQALQNRINERLMQENLLNSQFGRQQARAGLGLQGAGLYGEQANQNIGGAGDLIGSLAFNDQLNPGTSPTPSPSAGGSSYSPLYDWNQLDPTLNPNQVKLRGGRPQTVSY